VTRTGLVKLLDFGLAKLKDESRPQAGITVSNVVMGTPEYLAPEQAKNASAADIRADVYGLGCTLYQLLTGKLPFTGATAIQILRQPLEEPAPAIAAIRPDVPPQLAALVERMMAKDPADRPQTPRDVAAALAPFVKVPTAAPAPTVAEVPTVVE